MRESKSGQPRSAALDLEMKQKVQKWIEDKKMEKDALLFTNRNGVRYLDSSSLNKTLRRYCKRADVKKDHVSCHSFRHMFVTETIETCGMETARVLTGHKSDKTTALYNHPVFNVL